MVNGVLLDFGQEKRAGPLPCRGAANRNVSESGKPRRAFMLGQLLLKVLGGWRDCSPRIALSKIQSITSQNQSITSQKAMGTVSIRRSLTMIKIRVLFAA
jgi:hypothetical protein